MNRCSQKFISVSLARRVVFLVFSLTTFTSVLFFVKADLTMAARPQQRRPMAGGWANSDRDDQMVVEAAEFLFKTLLEERPEQYSFLKEFESDTTTPSQTSMKILQASQQVVAGMNFQLSLMITSAPDGDCLGALTAIVYNRFGEMSVTDWKEELSCAEAKIMLEETQATKSGGV